MFVLRNRYLYCFRYVNSRPLRYLSNRVRPEAFKAAESDLIFSGDKPHQLKVRLRIDAAGRVTSSFFAIVVQFNLCLTSK